MRLHCHRRELRLAEDVGLEAPPEPSVGVFVLDDVLSHAGPPRVALLLEAVEPLRAAYRGRGSALLVGEGPGRGPARPRAKYVRGHVPELRSLEPEVIHSWHELSATERDELAADYPVPIADHAARREAAIANFERARSDGGNRPVYRRVRPVSPCGVLPCEHELLTPTAESYTIGGRYKCPNDPTPSFRRSRTTTTR